MEGTLEATKPVKKHKRRGRKPKNKTIINTFANFDINPQDDNIIISLKKPKEGLPTDTIFPGFEYNTYSEVGGVSSDSERCCWNCTYPIEIEVSYPLKHVNGIFYIYGSFCSFGCAGRYIFDTYYSRDLWNKYNLLNYYFNETMETLNQKVQVAPDKLSLKKFGGTMSIKDYRCASSIGGYVTIPPVFPVDHTFHANEYKSSVSDSTCDLKLYRNKAMMKKNILATMDIKS
jgi:hypothetical protein